MVAKDTSALGMESTRLDDGTQYGVEKVTVVWPNLRGAANKSNVEVALWDNAADALLYYRRGGGRKKPPLVRTILGLLAFILVAVLGNPILFGVAGVLYALLLVGIWRRWFTPKLPLVTGVGSPTLVAQALDADPRYETFQNARDYLQAENATRSKSVLEDMLHAKVGRTTGGEGEG